MARLVKAKFMIFISKLGRDTALFTLSVTDIIISAYTPISSFVGDPVKAPVEVSKLAQLG